eukprot:4268813-Pyramimonas_sp.AAC.1
MAGGPASVAAHAPGGGGGGGGAAPQVLCASQGTFPHAALCWRGGRMSIEWAVSGEGGMKSWRSLRNGKWTGT